MWADDKSRSSCTRCGVQFGFWRRIHHCRHCGGIFCDSCSDFYVDMQNPISNPGIFNRETGPHRVCFSCFHKHYCYVTIYSGFLGATKTEVFGKLAEAQDYIRECKRRMILEGGTGKVLETNLENEVATYNKYQERGKGAMRSIMGETFFEDNRSDNKNKSVDAPSLGHLLPGGANNKANQQQRLGGNNNNNEQLQNHFGPTNNKPGGGTGGAAPAAFAGPSAAASAAAFAAAAVGSPSGAHPNDIPSFAYIACMCLEGGVKRFRFLQKDVHPDGAKLVLDFQAASEEEFAAASDSHTFVEACVLFDTDWKTCLHVATARFFYRNGPYIDSALDALRKERFVLCAHQNGRAESTIVPGIGDARLQLQENGKQRISSVIVSATGEPIGHSCPDVSWRRDLVDRADVDALRMFYGQTRGMFVATTVPSANSDVKVAESLWDVEASTQGQLRTTTQAWVWHTETAEKRCIVTPFLAGSRCPRTVNPGTSDLVSSRLRVLCGGSKSSAPVPLAAPSSAPSEGGSSTAPNPASLATPALGASAGPASPAISSYPASPVADPATLARRAEEERRRGGGGNGLSAAPPRPSAGGAAGAAPSAAAASAPNTAATSSSVPECPVCLDNYNSREKRPMVLPCCGHSICEACWKGVQRTHKGAGPLSCPRCRGEVPPGQNLVPNRTLLEAL